MEDKGKNKVSWLSIILAFALQLVASVWFLSGLSEAVRINSNSIESIATEQLRRTERVYSLDVLNSRMNRIEKDIDSIKTDVKSIARRK